MVLSPDVISTVVKYLEPKCLPRFMMDERCCLEKFVYDGSRYMMEFDECNAVYGMFPNIILVGMYFRDVGCNWTRNEFIIDVGRVVRCGVICGERFRTSELPRQLRECVGIKVLNLIDYDDKIINCDLSQFVNLHTVNIVTKNSSSSQYLHGLSKCKKLKCLRLVNVSLCTNDVREICKCKNLIHLEISNHIVNNLVCDKLHSLVIRNFIGKHLNNIKCDEVKCILLENCKHLNDIYNLRNFKNLECIEIVRCNKLKDVSVLDECVNLKWVRIEGECKMSARLVNLMFSCSRRHRCCHKYKYRYRYRS